MKRAFLGISLVCLALSSIAISGATSMGSTAAHSESLKSTIHSSATKICAAMKAKDFVALDLAMKGSMTADFTYVEDGREMSYEKMLEGMKMGLGAMTKVLKAKSELLTLSQVATSATATSKHIISGTMVGKDKKTHVLAYTGLATETYVKQADGWKMSKMVWKNTAMTMDGKPMDPSKM